MGIERKHAAILIAIFGITAIFAHVAIWHRAAHTPLPDWSRVPYEFNGWQGTDAAFDPLYGEDPSETNLLRTYRNGAGDSVVVYIGYYGDLAKILELHTPELCYPSQGWRILSTSQSSMGTFRGKAVPAKEMVVEKGGMRRLVVWWYMAGPHPFENRIRYVYKMLAMSALTGRSDGALVRFDIPVEAGSEEAAKKTIEDFATKFHTPLDQAVAPSS